MLLWYDIVPEEIAQHDEWHTREHFPERTGIPQVPAATRAGGAGARRRRGTSCYGRATVAVPRQLPTRRGLNDPTRRGRGSYRISAAWCGFWRRAAHRYGVPGAEMLALVLRARRGRADASCSGLRMQLASIAATPGFASAFVSQRPWPHSMTEAELRGRDVTVDRVWYSAGHDAAPIEEAARLARPEALRGAGGGGETSWAATGWCAPRLRRNRAGA